MLLNQLQTTWLLGLLNQWVVMASSGVVVRNGKILTESGKINVTDLNCTTCDPCMVCPGVCRDDCNATYTATWSGWTGTCCGPINTEDNPYTMTLGVGDFWIFSAEFAGDIWHPSDAQAKCVNGPTTSDVATHDVSFTFTTNHASCGADQFGTFDMNDDVTTPDDGNCCPDGTYVGNWSQTQGGGHTCASQNPTLVIS